MVAVGTVRIVGGAGFVQKREPPPRGVGAKSGVRERSKIKVENAKLRWRVGELVESGG